MADYTKYTFNGKSKLAKNKLVLEIVKKYISDNPTIDYESLKKVFPDSFNKGKLSVIKNEEEMQIWENDGRSETREDRFLTKDGEIINFNDTHIYVSSEWGGERFDKFVEYVKKELDYEVIWTKPLIKDDVQNVDKMVNNLMKTKNIILYGAPGVGKTHNYQKLITMIEKANSEKEIFDSITSNEKIDLNSDDFQKIKDDKRVEFVTFHQSYSYEDFIEGFRPSDENKIVRKDGIFKSLSNKAIKNLSQNFYIVIDEINRGNISKIFGELITLIEESKRDNYEVTLPYSKEKFKVPSNLYIIATMNSTDKSIATIDIALRRRFTFLKMLPNPNLVTNMESQIFMRKANQYISRELSEDYQLGHSYFMGDDVDLEFIKDYKIKPLLEEYFYVEDKDVETILTEIEKENLKDEQ
jgi:MoxR-like ATPase